MKQQDIDTFQKSIAKHLVEPFEQKIKDADPLSTDTLVYEIEKEIHAKAEDLIENDKVSIETIQELIGFAKKVSPEEYHKITIKEVSEERTLLEKEDYRAELLYQFFEEADSKASVISFFILNRSSFQDFIKNLMKVQGLFDEVEGLSGERKAYRVASLFEEVAERLYGNYCKMLYELQCVIDDKTEIKSFQKFGIIYNLLKDKISPKYSDLLHTDFALTQYRNAIAHKTYRYLPENDALLLWDYTKEKCFEAVISVDDLLGTVDDILWLTGNCYFQIYNMYLRKNYLLDTGFFKLNNEYLNKVDLTNLKGNKCELLKIEEKMKAIFDEIELKNYVFIRVKK